MFYLGYLAIADRACDKPLAVLYCFQLELDTQECDNTIRDFLLELGRRHFGYGAMPRHMELLVKVLQRLNTRHFN